MIRFNALLRNEGIDPSEVKLVRHQSIRQGRPTPFQLWRAADGRFDLYQCIQAYPKFKGAKLLASFVATPLDETLFVGIYSVDGLGKLPKGLIDPISEEIANGPLFYSLSASQSLGDYRGRLIGPSHGVRL